MGEECDKGDKVEGDGCGRDCKTEHPEVCPGTAIHLAKGMPVTVNGDTTGATDKLSQSPGGVAGNCMMGNWYGPDWVYAVMPEMSGSLNIALNTVYDNPMIHVRTACGGTKMDEVGCQVSFDPGALSLMMPVSAGQTYFVAADAWNGKFGQFTMTLTLQ